MTLPATDRNLPPIPEEERPELPDTLSQTFAHRQSMCPRSALLYHRHKGGPTSHEMDRGSAFHEFARRATLTLIEEGESQLPWEVGKDIAAEVLADPRWTITAGEADRIRTMTYHWCQGVVLDPETIVGVEQMLELDLGWVTLRGKADLILAWDDTIAVRDYKSGYLVPSQEDFEASFQQPFYAVLLAFGKQEGEPFPIGERAQNFDLAEWYPMYLWDEGLAERRTAISRPELLDHRLYVEAVLQKAKHAFETGEWPAVPGSHCNTCAAPNECPLPAHLRDYAGSINSIEEAEEAAAKWLFDKASLDAQWKELRNTAGVLGPIRIGSDLVLDFTDQESRETDWEGLEAAVQRSVQYGEPFRADDYRKVRHSTRFKKRKLTAAEREGEAA